MKYYKVEVSGPYGNSIEDWTAANLDQLFELLEQAGSFNHKDYKVIAVFETIKQDISKYKPDPRLKKLTDALDSWKVAPLVHTKTRGLALDILRLLDEKKE